MTWDDKDALAAEYALGTLNAADRAEAARGLERDLALRRLVEDWDRRLSPLAVALEPAPLPDGLLARIEAKVEHLQGGARGTTTIRAEAGEWQPMAEGVQMKLLSIDRVAGRRSFLVRMVPGSRYGHHEHPQDEECIVLEGDLSFGDLRLSAGDYHLARAGVPHPAAVSQGGCLLFIAGGL